MALQFTIGSRTLKAGKTASVPPRGEVAIDFTDAGVSDYDTQVDTILITCEKNSDTPGTSYYAFDVGLTGFKIKNESGADMIFNWLIVGV